MGRWVAQVVGRLQEGHGRGRHRRTLPRASALFLVRSPWIRRLPLPCS